MGRAGGKFVKWNPGPIVNSLGREVSLVLRRYTLPQLLNGRNPAVTVATVAVLCFIGFTVATRGLFVTLALALVLAVSLSWGFIRLHGYVPKPRQARRQADILVSAFNRNVVRPVLRPCFDNLKTAFAVVTVVAELSKWIGNDAVTIPFLVVVTALCLVVQRNPSVMNVLSNAAAKGKASVQQLRHRS